jgi:hypothetical protein
MWGVITSVVNAIFYTILNGSDNPDSPMKWVSYIIFFLGLMMGTLQYRNKANGGFLSFGEGYKTGFLITLVISVLSTLYFFIYLQMHPDFITKMLEISKTKMINKGLTQDQIDMSMSYAKKFTSAPIMVVFGFVGNIIVGAILSLLSAGITAKAKPLIEEDTNPAQ